MRNAEDRSFAALRIVFGFVWLVDAAFKWSPTFISNFTDYLASGAQNQPQLVQAWVDLWVRVINVNPFLFAIVVALAETAIAIGLLFGLFTRVAMAGGIALMLVIWSTAEGFGGPYQAGSTDVGAASIYVIVFVALWIGRCWRRWSLDAILRRKYSFSIGRW